MGVPPKSSKFDHDLVLNPMVTWGSPILATKKSNERVVTNEKI